MKRSDIKKGVNIVEAPTNTEASASIMSLVDRASLQDVNIDTNVTPENNTFSILCLDTATNKTLTLTNGASVGDFVVVYVSNTGSGKTWTVTGAGFAKLDGTAITNLTISNNGLYQFVWNGSKWIYTAISENDDLAKKDLSNITDPGILAKKDLTNIDVNKFNQLVSQYRTHTEAQNIKKFGVYDLLKADPGTGLHPYVIVPHVVSMVAQRLKANTDNKFYTITAGEFPYDASDETTIQFNVFIPKTGWTVELDGSGDVKDTKGTTYDGKDAYGFRIKDASNNYFRYRIYENDYGSFDSVAIEIHDLDKEHVHNSVTYDRIVIINVKGTLTKNSDNEPRLEAELWISNPYGNKKDSLPFMLYARAGTHDLNLDYLYDSTKPVKAEPAKLPITIFTQKDGKFFVRNADNTLPSGIDTNKVWSLSDQASAKGGTMPSGKTDIELPVGDITVIMSGGGGGGGAWHVQYGNNGGNTTFNNNKIIATGGLGASGESNTGSSTAGRSPLTTTVLSNSITKYGEGAGGGEHAYNRTSGGQGGNDGQPGNLVITQIAAKAGEVYDYTIGKGGVGVSHQYSGNKKGADGSDGYIQVTYATGTGTSSVISSSSSSGSSSQIDTSTLAKISLSNINNAGKKVIKDTIGDKFAHKVVKDSDYTPEVGQMLFVDLTSGATKDIIITPPSTDIKQGDIFAITVINKESASYTVKVGSQDLNNYVGYLLLFEYDGSSQWVRTEITKLSSHMKLTDMGDVSGTPTDKQVLVWDSTIKNASGVTVGGWKPGTITSSSSSSSGSSTFDGLTDTIITTPVDGDILQRAGNYWVNVKLATALNKYALITSLDSYLKTSFIALDNQWDMSQSQSSGSQWKRPDAITNAKAGTLLLWNGNYLVLKKDGDQINKSPNLGSADYRILKSNSYEKWTSGDYEKYMKGEVVWHNNTKFIVDADGTGKTTEPAKSSSQWKEALGTGDHEDYLRLDGGKLWSASGHQVAANKNIVTYKSPGKIQQADGTVIGVASSSDLAKKEDKVPNNTYNVYRDGSYDLKDTNGNTLTGNTTGSIPRTDTQLAVKTYRAMFKDQSNSIQYKPMASNGNNYVEMSYGSSGTLSTNIIAAKDSLLSVDTKSSGSKKYRLYLGENAGGNNYIDVALTDASNITPSVWKSTLGYLTAVPNTYKTKTENDALYQAKGTYLTAVPNDYKKPEDTSIFKLSNVEDITPTSSQDGYALTWDDSASKFKLTDISSSGSSFNPTITNAKKGDVIYYDGGWKNHHFGTFHKDPVVVFSVYDLMENTGIRFEPFIIQNWNHSIRAKALTNNTDVKIYNLDDTHIKFDASKKCTMQFIIYIPENWVIDSKANGDPKDTKGTTLFSRDINGVKLTDTNSKIHYYRIEQEDFGAFNTVEINSYTLNSPQTHNGVKYNRAVIINIQATAGQTGGTPAKNALGFALWLHQNTGSNVDSLPWLVTTEAGTHSADSDLLKDPNSRGGGIITKFEVSGGKLVVETK